MNKNLDLHSNTEFTLEDSVLNNLGPDAMEFLAGLQVRHQLS